MLPSTGYFKAINCPFYENGYCERPYCHFRHSRRDGASTSTIAADASQAILKPQSTGATVATNPDVIEQLVSAAVKKVLADQNVTDTENIVSKVVEGLKPKLVPTTVTTPQVLPPVLTHVLPQALPTVLPKVLPQVTTSLELPSQDPDVDKHLNIPIIPKGKSSQCTYNPTPIAELRKRHLPIPSYEPLRESKAVKRKSPDVELPWMDVIRNVSSKKETKIRYKPTAIGLTVTTEKSYVPSFRSDSPPNPYEINSNNDDSYIPEKRKKRKKESYHPKPKKRREEYVPRRPKIPLKDKQNFDDDDDIFADIFCSESNPNNAVDEEFQNVMEVEPKFSDDEEDITVIENSTKEECSEVSNKKISHDERGHIERRISNLDSFEKSPIYEEFSTKDEDHSRSTNKSSTKSTCEESRHKDKYKDSKHSKSKEDSKYSKSKESDSKSSKSKDDDSRHVKTKDEDSKHSRSKDEDSKYSKSRDKDRDEKRDREKERSKERERERERERDKHKHSSKSSDKERSSSSSKDSKSKDKDKEKEKEKTKDSKSSKESSSKSKKDSRSDKERSSSSKSSKDDRKESKHKSDEKSRSKSKSSSSDSKSKSSSHSHRSSDKPGSHSSHKTSRSDEKANTEDSLSEKNDDKSDQEQGRDDSPEFEEFSPFYDEQLLESDDSDYDVEAECRKIFQEYEVTDHPKDVSSKATRKTEAEEPEENAKKRVAHPSAVSNISKQVGPSQPPKRQPNPQQRMYERWRMMKEVAAQKAAERAAKVLESASLKKSLENHSNDHHVNGNGRIRIAQVPYALSLALEKKKVLENAAKVEMKTAAQTKKGGSRVAHVPQVVPQLVRPEPLQVSGTQKFPLNVRQFYVNAMQDICIQIYDNSDDAAQRAVREELACYERCKAVNVYKNSCMLTVHRLRKEVEQKSDETSTSYTGLISHEAVLAGKVKGSWSVVKQRKLSTDIKGASLYHMLTKWILTEQNLKDNGYPRPHPDGPKGRAKLYVLNTRGQSNISKVPNERFCCRCNKSFMVDKHGFTVRKENCIYHYARKFTFRGESKYMCCKQDGSSDGCCDASTHVWDLVDPENLRGYVSTFDKDNASDEEQGVYALDCEMCYTTQGLELTRVTVINENLQVVYESLVKPTHPIIDYNTRFSGISEEDMKNVTTTLLDVQATFLSMFSSKTILIGHSLESDFKALKLLHNTVVDTSVMFPHKHGPPFKRALKNLCSEYLRRIIQNDLGGHDSKEDAVACMELVLWKIKEEAKLQ